MISPEHLPKNDSSDSSRSNGLSTPDDLRSSRTVDVAGASAFAPLELASAGVTARDLEESASVQPKREFRSQLHLQLRERFLPASVLVGPGFNIIHLSETAGRFLRVIDGAPTFDLLKAVHPALRSAMRSTLCQAIDQNVPAQSPAVRIEIDGKACDIVLHVAAAQGSTGVLPSKRAEEGVASLL